MVVTGPNALTKMVAEAEELKKYRTDGTLYFDKCAELVERIRFYFEDIKIDSLNEVQIKNLEAIKEIIFTEEQFAKASYEHRNADYWKAFLND